MIQNKLCWDTNNAAGLPQQRNPYQYRWLYFVLKVPLRYLRPNVTYSVQCDRIMQRAYSKQFIITRQTCFCFILDKGFNCQLCVPQKNTILHLNSFSEFPCELCDFGDHCTLGKSLPARYFSAMELFNFLTHDSRVLLLSRCELM